MPARISVRIFAAVVTIFLYPSPTISCAGFAPPSPQTADATPCNQAAFKQAQQGAAQGTASAKKRLADDYALGSCVTQDIAKAASLYKESAELGDADAQYEYALYLLEGKEVPLDPAQAAHWFERSALQNNPQSQYALGSLYVQGRGVTKNLVEGYKWMRISAPDTDRHTNDVLALVAKSMTVDEVARAKAEAETWRQAHKAAPPQSRQK